MTRVSRASAAELRIIPRTFQIVLVPRPANDVPKARAAVSSTVRWRTPRRLVPPSSPTCPGTPAAPFQLEHHQDGLPPLLPPARPLPNPGTDGSHQGRLCVYMNHAPSTEAVALRPQTGLTGPGSHRYSYAGLGKATSISHPHNGCHQPLIFRYRLARRRSFTGPGPGPQETDACGRGLLPLPP